LARVLITRPADLGRETAARLEARGHQAILLPLLDPRPLAWTPPKGDFDALLFTSPQAPALAGDLARYRHLPAWAIGERTADAVRSAGFADVRVGRGGGRRLHLAGRDLAPSAPDADVTIVPVYAAELADPELARATLRGVAIDWALLFSARAASHFAAIVDSPADLSIAAISARALAAAGPGWRQAVAAAEPTEAGVLAAAGLLCEKDTL
jgi:uroporphyrinogen-III synthase